MIDHMSISPRDIESAQLFHDAALEPLGISTVMEVRPEQSGGYHGIGYGTGGKPFFWLSSDSRRVISKASGGTGIHIAFEAESPGSGRRLLRRFILRRPSRRGTGDPRAGVPYRAMTNEVPHPYSITVEPLNKPEGHFGWALRKHGKLAERSDRAFTSEAKAFEAAMKAIERNETGFGSR